MGGRLENSSERLRTVWTPEMDRYFIDLMLEQVSKGNKFVDHLFSKKAWKLMSSLFNTKFKFQYEKDVLKNRYKTLRNLYKAVKNLLSEKGFSWDENRQMVTAENVIWDQYIKEHPDARSFRIKTIPYYNDLRLIFRDGTIAQNDTKMPESLPQSSVTEIIATPQTTTSSEGVSVDVPEILLAVDNNRTTVAEAVVDGSEANLTGRSLVSRSRTYWQPPMDRYFIDLMLDQVHKVNHVDGVFRKQAWTEMITSFNAKFGFNYEVEVLKNRYKTLRRQYNVMKSLLLLDGFSWDDARQMVIADDYVWQDYIRTHTDARQFMTRPVPYYKDLCVIISDKNIEENDCFSIKCLGLQNEVEETSGSDEVMETALNGSKIVMSNQKNKRPVESQFNFVHPKKLRGKEEGTGSAPPELIYPVSFSSDKVIIRDDENLNGMSIESIIETVQALPEMDEDLVLDAIDFLEDEIKAKTFMALDNKLRKKWLLRKLRSP